MLLRRPLLVAFVLGCAISFLASGRLTLRLVADGTLSFAFVPACQLAGFALVYRRRHARLAFPEAVDRFFQGNTAWLWLLVAVMASAAVLPVTRQLSLAPLLLVTLVPIAWSVAIDLRFFRDVMGQTARGAVRDVVIQRAVAWTAATLYFFGVAVGPLSLAGEIGYLFVEMWQILVAWAAEIR
jgi:hypothetical protein